MNEGESPIYEFAEFQVDAVKRLLMRRNGETIPLTPKVFDTLLYLVEHQGVVLDKDELMRAIWPDTVVEENNLNQSISALRRVLGESRGENRYIATVPGRGYRFVADVKTAAAPEPRAESESIAPAFPSHQRTDRRKVHLQFTVLAGIGVVALALALYYLWGQR